MTDPAITVATLAVCIALLATVVSWIAFDNGRYTHKQHKRPPEKPKQQPN